MSASSDRLYDILEEVKRYLSIIDRDRTSDADGLLHHEGRSGSVPDVLSKFGTEVNAINARLGTLLTIALKNNESAQVITELLVLGGRVTTRQSSGRTPLHYLLLNEEPDIETVRLLLDYNADVNAKDKYLQTPLHCVLRQRNCTPEVVELLLKYGADVAAEDDVNRTPLFHHFLRYVEPDLQTVGLLLHYKADVNARDMFLQTPLHCVLRHRNCRPEVVELLCKHGADETAADWENRSPLDFALAVSNVVCAKVIIKYTLLNKCDCDWKIIDIEKSANRWYDEVATYIEQCEGEIDDMKGHRVNNKFSLYDWFVNRRLIPKPLYTSEMISEDEISNRYPVYGRTLWTVIKISLDRADLLFQLEELQSTDVCSKLGSDCMRKIVEYITNIDLFNFISALR